ncbi:MAG: cytochrome b562 [Pseudobdellovibrio sp.]
MKKIFLALSLISAMAFAQTTPPQESAPTSLKAVMKDMSATLKTIAAQAADPSKNAASEKLANDLVKSITQAKAFMPDTATDQAGKDMFIKMIDQTIDLAKQLATAFHQNDNAKVNDILNSLANQKKDGHDRFKQ